MAHLEGGSSISRAETGGLVSGFGPAWLPRRLSRASEQIIWKCERLCIFSGRKLRKI